MHTERVQNPPSVSSNLTVAIPHGDWETELQCGTDELSRSPRVSPRSLIEEGPDEVGNTLLAAAVASLVILGFALLWIAEDVHAHTVQSADCRAIAKHTDGSLAVKRAAARGCTRHRTQHAAAHQLAACGTRVPCIIRYVFGPTHGNAAVSVSWCESTHRTTASNGQYQGLFQMGSNERATYGHGPDALTQSQAAHRYFIASGSDWSPWECKP